MSQTFFIVPAGYKPLWIIVPTIVIILGVAIILGNAAYASQKANFEISPLGLRLNGDLYGRLLPASSLMGEAARVINIKDQPQYQPVRRTLGTGLPGYLAGWFRLRNGEKALLYVTDPRQVIYIPTTENYAIMLSINQPAVFLEKLRLIAPKSSF